MARYRATLAYDGTAYLGFQRQAGDTPTIQGALERALARISGQQVTVIGAGRTDSGVHARGQVIAFDVDWGHDDQSLLRAINAHLPADIALQAICQHEGFHPRFDALSRVYSYTIVQASQRQPLLRHNAWWIRQPLNLKAMQQAATLLVGEHDFATFGQPSQGTSTIRKVLVSEWQMIVEHGADRLIYKVEANAFLQHMVRRMVGALADVGRGALGVREFEALFHQRQLQQGRISVAPPQGLVLELVRYP